MKVLYIIEVFILITIIYFCVTLLSVLLLDEKKMLQGGNNGDILQSSIVIDEYDSSEIYTTDCNSHPKKCPNGYNCDCSKLCMTRDAKKIEIKDGNIESFRQFSELSNGTYCYIPVSSIKECKKGFGSWIFDEDRVWKCVPIYRGVFTTEGKQLAGEYPFSENLGVLSRVESISEVDYNDPNDYSIDCSNLKDEYGKPIITFKLENNGLTFCLKDYCISGLKGGNHSSNYANGNCICDPDSKNIIFGDLSSPCVLKANPLENSQPSSSSEKQLTFKIGCFNEHTFLKDLDNYLIPCPSPQMVENYLSSRAVQISTYSF